MNVLFAISLCHKHAGEIDEISRRSHSAHSTVAIKVSTYTHVVDTHNVHCMVEMFQHIPHRCLAFRTKESMIDGYLAYTTLVGKRLHLTVGEIAGMVAQGAATAMAAHYRSGTDVHGIPKTLLGGMAQIHHHPEAIHLAYHLSAKLTHSIVGVTASCTVADVVVAIMAEGDIHHSPIGKVLHVGDVALKGKSVLYAEHNGFLSVILVGNEFGRSAGKGKIAIVGSNDVLYLIEYQVGIFLWTVDIKAHVLSEGLTLLGLRQISHHDSGILTTIGHLVQIHKQLRVTAVEAHIVGKEHRCVAVGVECENTIVHITCGTIVGSLTNKPLEQRESVVDTFGMPLHTNNRLHLRTFHSLNNTVARTGYNTESIPNFAYCLMMEGIDIQRATTVNLMQYRILAYAHRVGRHTAMCVLTMLYQSVGVGNILYHRSSQCHCQGLYASAYTQHGYLSVIGKTCDEQFGQVALAINGM